MVKVPKNLISSRGYSGFGYNRFQALRCKQIILSSHLVNYFLAMRKPLKTRQTSIAIVRPILIAQFFTVCHESWWYLYPSDTMDFC